MKKRLKVIIDTDPGVDDTAALTFALNDSRFDIKLLCTNSGNIAIEQATRNLCHLLDLFDKDIPVVQGYEKRLGSNTEHAYFLHGVEGMGNYMPPKTTKHKPIKKDCADAIYEVLKQNPYEITMIILGPHTNFAYLLMKHPDAKKLIKNCVMMGGAPDGIKSNPNHASFNIRTDVPAFRQTLDSGLPVLMCPSRIGRDVTYFGLKQITQEELDEIEKKNNIVKFLKKVHETYWEPDYPEQILSACDLSTIYYLLYPRLYKTKRAFIELDVETGKITAHYNRKGNFKIVQDVNRKKFQKFTSKKLIELSKLQITNKTFIKNLSGK